MIRVVAAVIYNPKTKSFFVGQRAKTKQKPLKWEFIGGKIEPGEEVLAATEREVEEEIGKKVIAKKIIETVFHDYGEVGQFEVNFVECGLFKGEPKYSSYDFETCAWVSKNKILEIDLLEGDLAFAKKLVSTVK